MSTWPKTDVRHWRTKVFKRDGTDYHVRIAFGGRRERFPLRTPNKSDAEAKARDIYLSLLSAGWDSTIEKFKPWTVDPKTPADQLTVGEYIESARAVADVRPNTFLTYERKFRFLVSEMEHLKSDRKKKHDYHNGGHIEFREKINSVPLGKVTPAEIEKWRVTYIKQRGTTAPKRNAARQTAASIIRNAKALFSRKILKALNHLEMPSPLPFDDVTPGKRPRSRYKSKINLGTLVVAAKRDLDTPDTLDQFKIFLLAACTGLRKSEIDSLLWSQFKWQKKELHIEPHEYGDVKTEGSNDVIDLDDELLKLFKKWQRGSKSKFVVSSAVDPRTAAHWKHYRCEGHFKKLVKWLKGKGVKDQKPLHTLRKEFGSVITSKFGIFAASHALRHSSIAVTREHYADTKERVSLSISELTADEEQEAA